MRYRPTDDDHQRRPGVTRRVRRTATGMLLGLAVLVGGTGCGPGSDPGGSASGALGGPAAAGASPHRSVPPDPVHRKPAQSAGGACKLLDFAQVKATIGTDFHVAVARSRGATQSCVLQVLNTAYPDLILTLAPTRADATVFKSTVAPKGAQSVPKLGKAAYSTVVGPDGAAGAAVEVGWLGDGGRIVTVRYTHQTGTKTEVAGKKVAAVVALARKLEAAR